MWIELLRIARYGVNKKAQCKSAIAALHLQHSPPDSAANRCRSLLGQLPVALPETHEPPSHVIAEGRFRAAPLSESSIPSPPHAAHSFSFQGLSAITATVCLVYHSTIGCNSKLYETIRACEDEIVTGSGNEGSTQRTRANVRSGVLKKLRPWFRLQGYNTPEGSFRQSHKGR